MSSVRWTRLERGHQIRCSRIIHVWEIHPRFEAACCDASGVGQADSVAAIRLRVRHSTCQHTAVLQNVLRQDERLRAYKELHFTSITVDHGLCWLRSQDEVMQNSAKAKRS